MYSFLEFAGYKVKIKKTHSKSLEKLIYEIDEREGSIPNQWNLS
jgi:hypothetical protein